MTEPDSAIRAVRITVDRHPVDVPADVTVAAGLLNAGIWSTRTSVRGDPRGPLCGMGVCFECRVTIDGVAAQRACLVAARDGMRVETTGGRASSGGER